MTDSWYNISEQYKNNNICYGVISEEKDEERKVNNPFVTTYYAIEFSPGSYSYNNINAYIKDVLTINNNPSEAIRFECDLPKLNVC